MDKPSISLCMIVKNEEEYLPKCLRSVQCIVDEIIIVDTGSTDDTVAIARAFGAKVIEMPWEDSFSAARNRGLDEATGDWILWLDADEEMDVAEADKLKELLARDAIREQNIEGIQFCFCTYLEGGGTEYICLQRMVRNRPEYRFEGRVHEQILPSMLKANPGMQIGQVGIHIYHEGNLIKNIVRQDKIRRNQSLLLQSLEEYPKYRQYHYYLGVELYRLNELESALEQFNIALANPEGFLPVVLASAHKYRLALLESMGRYDDMVRYSMESIEQFPDFTDLHHLRAVGWQGLGHIDKAIHSMRQALSLGPAPEEYPSMTGIGTYLTCRDLGILYASAGNVKDSDLYLTVASLMVGYPRIRFQGQPDISSLAFRQG
ncbi:glycosyltransferase [Paenibacillus sp. P96]|uniref:Glycosyltransferase n=1 Tax=Paenibacillus zeirhizosphaerae TaxID=2987519 RepID=A0ABT9FXE0_9BACL|nr:TPR domain-containing glycosyltransferase [Paenibacillus sp. P96]MDP4099398.1 glycosyltransferase [Paenibacillus sp. P96]